MHIMDISGRRLTTLETLIHVQPKVLYCNFNLLENLVGLPHTVETLYCYANKLTSLEGISPNIKELYCGDNLLTSLKELKTTTLEIISCSYNQLKTLHGLPKTIKSVCCFGDSLENISGLSENCREIVCRGDVDFEEIPLSTCYINGRYASDIKLQVYNNKLIKMGMHYDTLSCFYKIKESDWKNVNEKYLIWKYRIGGEKWKEALDNCRSLFKPL
jgi:Leucine-rich repeat (LRR) protein